VLKDSIEHPARVAERHAEDRGAEITHVYGHALNGYAAKIAPAQVGAVRQDPSVVSVEPDVRGGIVAQGTPTGIDRIFAASNEALAINEEDDLRADVDVAVFDTAIDASHADLDVVGQVNCHEQACKEEESAGGGHGTHVAGTIAAIDNGVGVVGVAPGARLWSVRVLSPSGFGNLSDLIAGIDWVTATREDEDPENDIEVTNASLRYWNETSSVAFNKALKASIEAGIVHVAAAGNEAETVQFIPGNNSEEITVSALTDYNGHAGGGASPTCQNYGLDDRLASFSNFGTVVDVAAPGVCIYSTWAGGGYATISGTSMASPHVAGAAAILAANDKPESRADVEAIRDTIVEEGNLNWTDTSGDGVQEPLLDVDDEAVFDPQPTNYSMTLADVNGDGSDDLVGRDDTAGPTAGDRLVALSTGSGFAAPSSWGVWSPQLTFNFLLGDVDGDGKADSVGRDSAGEVRVGLSTGGGFAASSKWGTFPTNY
jgi:subtilisin family serine protease